MWFVGGFLSLIGRLMLCAAFLMAAVAHLIPKFSTIVQEMEGLQIPMPTVMLVGAIATLIIGSLLIIFGYQTRLGALLLLLFLGCVTYFYHDFWTATDEQVRSDQLLHFMKNLSLGGMMVWLVANGGGSWSLDRRAREDDADFV